MGSDFNNHLWHGSKEIFELGKLTRADMICFLNYQRICLQGVLPKALAYHCAVKVDNLIYIYGGFEYPDIPNRDTYILNLKTRTWQTISASQEDICGEPPPYRKTTCATWNGDNFLIVPTLDIKVMESCTAILNLKTRTWSALRNDKRNLVVDGTIAK